MSENEALQLDDLREAWARLDQRVESDFARLEAMTSSLAADRAQTLVRRAVWPPTIELVATAVGLALVSIGLFHGGSPVFTACTIGVLAFFGTLIVSAVWQIATICRIDPAAPVVATQRQLGRVSALRVFETKWTLLLSPVLWAPFLVVVVELPLKLLFDVEVAIFSAGFLLTNVLVGVVLTAGLFCFSRWLARRLRGTSFLRDLLDEFAGRRLTAARAFLARLDGFEHE